MNVMILIAMTTVIPVIIIVAISIDMFAKIITPSNHSLKLEIMVAASWPLAASLFVIPIWQPQVQLATTTCFIASERVAVPRNKKIIMFSTLGITFKTPTNTYTYPEHCMSTQSSSPAPQSWLAYPPWTPPHCDMAGCWQINSILAYIVRRNAIRILNQYPFLWNILIWA